MIAIRPAQADDAAAIAAIYAPHVAHGIASFEVEAPDADAMAARMATSQGYYPWLVAVAEGEGNTPPGSPGDVLGYAYAARFRERAAYDWVVETSIYMAASAQRRGAGQLLYKALIATLRAQGFTQAVGAISLPNDPSIAVHEAVGFRRAGVYRAVGYKMGRWIDVGLWQCALADPAAPPAAPRSFSEVGLVRS